MLKVIYFLLTFLRELVYDSKDEYSYTSSKFNIRKGVVFVLLVGSLIFVYFSGVKVIKLSATIVDLKSAIIRNSVIDKQEIENYKARIKELEGKVSDCSTKGKKERTAPSDSGIGAEKNQSTSISLYGQSNDSGNPAQKNPPKKTSLTREQENAFFKEYLSRK